MTGHQADRKKEELSLERLADITKQVDVRWQKGPKKSKPKAKDKTEIEPLKGQLTFDGGVVE